MGSWVGLALAGWLSGAGGQGRTWHVSPRELAGVPAEVQFRTISEAARRVEPGDTVVIHEGVYRETVVVEKDGTPEKPIRFAAAAGERVVVTGADLLDDLRKEGPDLFSARWPHKFLGWTKNLAHPDDDYHRMIGRAEQVFVRGYPLLQVLSRERLTRGTFFVDHEGRRLYFSPRDDADPLKDRAAVEASSRGLWWHSKGARVHLRGIRFRYAANAAQHGGAIFSGDCNVVEDCVFERANSSGAAFTGRKIIVRRCVFQDNGQLGFGANRAHDLLFTGGVVRNNNLKGFNRGWEAGGNKLCFCRGAVLEKSVFAENRGNGVWFDIGNEDCVVRNCLIADNEDAGIFYEISYGLKAHDNVIVGNGFAGTPGAWGASAAVVLSSSPGGVVERNLMVGNKEGFNFREQNRKTPLIDDRKERWIWNHSETIRNNVMALNRDAQTWGWFDIADGRHWPAALQDDKEKEQGRAEKDLAAGYQARDSAGAPTGLSLEKLKIVMENNLYFAAPWQGLFNWGVTWKRHKRYSALDEVRKELRLEAGSAAVDPGFADVASRDFRITAGSPAIKKACYPRGDVPGVVLGVIKP